jgi:hypothetical protein
MANETNIKVLKLEVDTGTGAIKVNGITKSIQEASAATKEFVNSSKQLGKALDQNRDKTGLAGAAVVEIGRTISDSNYGFTAMANNISQLATLMTTLVATSGGVRQGFRELGKAMAGPLGIIVAFQVVIAVLERFAKNSKNTETSLNNIEKAAGGAGAKLTILKKSIEDNNISLEEKEKAIAAANKEYKDLNLQLDENGQLTKDSTTAIDNKIEALKRLAKANAYLKELEKLYGELALSATKTDSEFVSTANNIGKVLGQLGQTGGLLDVMIGTEQENRERIQQQINALLKAVGDQNLVDEMFGSKDGKLKPSTKEKIKKIATEIIGTTIDQIRKLQKEGDSIIDRLLGEEPSAWAERQLKESAKNALKGLKEIDIQEESPFGTTLDFYVQQIAMATDAAAMVIDSAFESDMVREQNKTTALNNELRERLANEKISAEERKSIQVQIAANDEKLRLKQEETAKKRFKVEKALRISMAVMDTYSSALRAYASQLIPGDPTSIVRAEIARGVTVAMGLANVASIAMQKFVTSASSSSPGLGASGVGGGGVLAPDFNIVGQSASNQIAAAVQGQFQQPIKAYVVSKDVSTAQEMDRNIIGSATLG